MQKVGGVCDDVKLYGSFAWRNSEVRRRNSPRRIERKMLVYRTKWAPYMPHLPVCMGRASLTAAPATQQYQRHGGACHTTAPATCQCKPRARWSQPRGIPAASPRRHRTQYPAPLPRISIPLIVKNLRGVCYACREVCLFCLPTDSVDSKCMLIERLFLYGGMLIGRLYCICAFKSPDLGRWWFRAFHGSRTMRD